jgi:AAHS family 4-hydroxybenzoate transporter-like MFS transporter
MDNDRHPEVDVGALLENRPLGRFQLLTLFFGCLILFVDGLDFSAPNVGAKAISAAFHAEPSAMGFVFGWGYFGMFVGSVLLGYIGDKYGRKIGVVLGVLAYSLPALFTILATTMDELALWRFLAGIGIGGVVPNTIALLTETAPKRHRVIFVMIAFVGYSLGNSASAQIAAWFMPAYGWSIVFLAAGGAGTLLSAVLVFVLPESIPFLAAAKPDSPKLRHLLMRAAPETMLGPDTRIILRRPASESHFSLKLLFSSYRRLATPLLWLAYFADALTFMTLSAWLTFILVEAGLPQQQAQLTFSAGAFGAMLAIPLVGRGIDKFGPKVVVLSAIAAISAITYLGTPGLTPMAIIAVAVFGYACAASTHHALNGIVGGFYPTIIRGNGVGYATGMGRVAAIFGPVIAGYLLSANLPVQMVLVVIAAPDLVVAAACVGLDVLRRSASARADFANPIPAREAKEQLAKEQLA